MHAGPVSTDFEIRLGSWAELGEWAVPVRQAVFIEEQGIPAHEEWDSDDAVSTHAIALCAGECVGTARLLPTGKVGRMAVLKDWRGRQVGGRLLATLLAQAERLGFAEIKLSSQAHVVGFYKRFGFVEVGAPHEEVGIAHQWMMIKIGEKR